MRLISSCTAVALAITGLGGCRNKEPKNETEIVSSAENFAAVYIYNDNAVVFLEGYGTSVYDASIYIFEENNTFNNEEFYGRNIIRIKYKDKDELENKIEAFIGEDANITYYDEIGNAKTLS